MVFSTQTFVVKFAGAFSGLISGVGLKLIGFVPNVEQSTQTIWGMTFIMIVIPAVLSALCLVVYRRGYKLDEKYFDKVIAELHARKEAADAPRH